jgi:hypothetical protein
MSMLKHFLAAVFVMIAGITYAQKAQPLVWFDNAMYRNVKGDASVQTATVAQLSAIHGLKCRDGWKLIRADVSIIPAVKSGDIVGPFVIKNAQFTAEVLGAFQNKAGMSGVVRVESIKAMGPDGLTRTLNPLVLKYGG